MFEKDIQDLLIQNGLEMHKIEDFALYQIRYEIRKKEENKRVYTIWIDPRFIRTELEIQFAVLQEVRKAICMLKEEEKA